MSFRDLRLRGECIAEGFIGDGSQLTNLPAATVAIGDVTGLTAALAAKAASTHSHAVSDVTGLQAALDAKAATSALSTLSASNLTSGTVPTARLGSGTADSTTYLRGDNTWVTISAGATNLDGLSDVVITSAATGQLLNHNGTNWVNTATPTLTTSLTVPTIRSASGTPAASLSLLGGTSTGQFNAGGDIFVTAGDGNGTSANGGGVYLEPGNGTLANGSIYLSSSTSAVRVQVNSTGIGFLGATPIARQTGGAATANTSTYGSTEAGMLQKVYDAMRNFGFLT